MFLFINAASSSFVITDSKEPEDLDATKRLMERLLKTPPDPKKEKRPDRSGTPHSKEDSENSRDAE